MQTINLKQYYPFCKEDIFVEVSDEIVEAFLLDKRAEAARERKMFRYKAFYSLDCNDGIENAAIGWAQPSPAYADHQSQTILSILQRGHFCGGVR